MKSFLCNKTVTFKSHFCVLSCYIYPILPTAQKDGIYPKPWNHDFKHSRCSALGIYNKFHGEQKSREKDLRQIGHNTRLLKSIKIRQMKFLGHVMRHKKLEHLSLTGLIPGKKHEEDNNKHT